jgi:hypothetical protein
MKNLFFFIIIINIIKIHYSNIFKTIYLSNEVYLIINSNGIYTYNKESLQLLRSYVFENQFKLKSFEIEHISFAIINEKNCLFILAKYSLYIFSIEGIFKSNYLIFENNEINYYSINFFKCIDSTECYYFIEYINPNNNNLVITLYKYNFDSETNNLVTYTEFNIKTELEFNCHIMINSDDNSFLSCFFKSEDSNEISCATFMVDNNNNIFNSNNNSYPINNTKIIKSIISFDKTKALICFIDNSNKGICITYDINTFAFNDYNNILENCFYSSSNSFKVIWNKFLILIIIFYIAFILQQNSL